MILVAVLCGGAESSRAEVLVSNLSGSQSLAIGMSSSIKVGGRFITGGDPALLRVVTVRVLEQSVGTTGVLQVSIWSDGGDDLPGVALLALTVPPIAIHDVFVNHVVPYDGPTFVLEPATTYWVVVGTTGNGRSVRGSNSEPSVGDMGDLSWAREFQDEWRWAREPIVRCSPSKASECRRSPSRRT